MIVPMLEALLVHPGVAGRSGPLAQCPVWRLAMVPQEQGSVKGFVSQAQTTLGVRMLPAQEMAMLKSHVENMSVLLQSTVLSDINTALGNEC